MMQPRGRGEVSGRTGREAPWRRFGPVMIVTANVAVMALLLRQPIGRDADAGVHVVGSSLAILLGIAATWAGRNVLAWFSQTEHPGLARGCVRCGRGSLRMLTRTRPGRPPEWVGARCAGCGTTYRRVDGRIVAIPPATEPVDEAGIRFEDETIRPGEVRFPGETPG